MVQPEQKLRASCGPGGRRSQSSRWPLKKRQEQGAETVDLLQVLVGKGHMYTRDRREAGEAAIAGVVFSPHVGA